MKKGPKIVLRVAGLTLLVAGAAYALRDVRWDEVGRAFFSRSSASLLVAAFFAYLANVCAGLRWRAISDYNLSRLRHIGLAFAGPTGNILLPFRAGEAVRPFYVKLWKPKVPLKSLVTVTLADKVIEAMAFLPLVILGAAWLGGLPQLADFRRFLPYAVALFVVCVVAGTVVLLLSPRFERFKIYRQRFPFAYFWALGTWASHTLFFSALVGGDLRLGLGIMIGTALASALPLAPGNLGTYEAAFVWVATRAGLPLEEALAVAILAHVLQFLTALSIGVPLLARWGWPKAADLEKVTKAEKNAVLHPIQDLPPEARP